MTDQQTLDAPGKNPPGRIAPPATVVDAAQAHGGPVGVRLVVPGDPVPWAAKATSRKTGNRFLPQRQAKATQQILAAVERLLESDEVQPCPLEVPLKLICTFYVARPKSHYGTGRNAARLKVSAPKRPCGRPDLTNLVKLIEDGIVLGGLVHDDDQIVTCAADKFYTSTREEHPRSIALITRA